ncbi:SDR family NAD(P)-dependent oxidoreductase [Modestobacter versicolor]|uniref:NAD(P)-dependent dehydrogenase (Short-subunit alcohol dehydrogenase family) n=1 Tax=Modestobacter versicolor TaxID=429133 RepID=A0A323V3J2_9ACTN|nr:SDR family oxidoreductase [Modestobacter versicolor]MBB3677077.1 NAD(P)-dependent dehydrogenase (short-subunit alcohol dehydrogenase family) [Modestobacter versicolor]PZA19284.1 short-chain dehydrogenase [Modestobacter versicolor]
MNIAVVTGASSGIGQSAAVQLAARGQGVVLTYNANADGAHETVARIQALGGTAVALPLDVGRSETFPAFRDELRGVLADTWQAEQITGLVNNAGIARMAMYADTTEEVFDEIERVVLRGPYFLTQALLPLLADGGAIVSTTSNAALFSGMEPGFSAYGTLKGGLVVLTRYLAKELSVRGIRVNSVSPGSTRTRLGDDAFTKHPEVIAPLAARTALGRVGEPDDIGQVIAFLLSDEAGWITAQDIEVSGGYNL